MATWDDVRTYIHANYRAEDVSDGLLKLVFGVDNLRSQVVFLSRQVLADGEEWLAVQSVVANVQQVDLRVALDIVEGFVVGALSQVGELLVLKNTVALLNLDINELVRPMQLITASADGLERALTGADAF